VEFKRVTYSELSGKQQEIYNFQKIASVLADYGFNCIKLADDWQGADFLAYHKDGVDTLKVQLKGRLTIDKKYRNKGLHIAFPLVGHWCVVGHDQLINIVGETTSWLNTPSWELKDQYHSAKPSKKLVAMLKPYMLYESMKCDLTIGQLFDEEPLQWGLRGDPHLWRAMRSRLSSTPLPSSVPELNSHLEQEFHALAGFPLSTHDDFYTADFDCGGISSGGISPKFWREKVIPLLIARYSEL
jgi:hypothetical protein